MDIVLFSGVDGQAVEGQLQNIVRADAQELGGLLPEDLLCPLRVHREAEIGYLKHGSALGFLGDSAEIIGSGLVDVVIQPVGVQQLARAAPVDDGGQAGVVAGEVVGGQVRVQPPLHVPEILLGQGVVIVLRVREHKESPVVRALHPEHPRLVGQSQDLQLRLFQQLLHGHLGVAGVRGVEAVVKAPEQRGALADDGMLKNAGQLVGQGTLLHTIMVVQPRLGSPADVEGGVDMGTGPVHDLAKLPPVVHLLKLQVFHRSAGDNHAVELLVLYLIEGGVEGLQVGHVRVLGGVALGLEQMYIDLEGRIGQLAQQLGLGDDLGGHQVEDEQAQGADVLVQGAALRHDKDVFALQHTGGGERVGDTDGHGQTSLGVIIIIDTS